MAASTARRPKAGGAPRGVPAVGEPWGWDEFERVSTPAHLLTEQGLILETNAAFERLFGAPRARFVGRHLAVLNNASVAANLRLLGAIRAETASRGLWRGTVDGRRSDGSFFRALVHVYPMRAAGRRYFVCFQQELAPARTDPLHSPEQRMAG